MSRNLIQGFYLGRVDGKHYRAGNTVRKCFENRIVIVTPESRYVECYFENCEFRVRGNPDISVFSGCHFAAGSTAQKIVSHTKDAS